MLCVKNQTLEMLLIFPKVERILHLDKSHSLLWCERQAGRSSLNEVRWCCCPKGRTVLTQKQMMCNAGTPALAGWGWGKLPAALLRYNLYIIKLSYSKRCNSLGFSLFTRLWDHHYN